MKGQAMKRKTIKEILESHLDNTQDLELFKEHLAWGLNRTGYNGRKIINELLNELATEEAKTI